MEDIADKIKYVDVLRFIAIAMANGLIFLSAKVALNYNKATKRELSKGEWKGILPLHVYLISSSYLLLIFSSIHIHVANIGKRLTVTFMFSMIAYVLGYLALAVILRYEQRRVKYGRMLEDAETTLLRETIQSMLSEFNLVDKEEKENGNLH